MRKLFLGALISVVLLSCSKDELIDEQNSIGKNMATTVSKDVSPVSLIKAWKTMSFYRGSKNYINKFTVRVANLNPVKKVSIYHERIDGTWNEIPLSFDLQIDKNSEIWRGAFGQSGFDITKIYADEFVVRYEVNEKVYWDNNNGANYKMEIEDGYYFAQNDLNISVDQDFTSFRFSPTLGFNRVQFHVDVRNIKSEKEVEVVYTTDGWKTKNYKLLTYSPNLNSGPLLNIFSPNSYDVERWRGVVDFDTSVKKIEYAVVYRVNNQEFWDNNYGKNYVEAIK